MTAGSALPQLELGTHPEAPKSQPAAWQDGWWTEQTDLASDAEFYSVWLRRQCAGLSGARGGVILRAGMDGLLATASWPAARLPGPELTRVAERAATAARPIIAWARQPGGSGTLELSIGLAIRSFGTLAAVVAVVIDVPGGIESVDPDARAYSDTILSSKPVNRRACFGTSSGSKLPSRSRGVSIRSLPSPVSTVFAVLPLRWLVVSSGRPAPGS